MAATPASVTPPPSPALHKGAIVSQPKLTVHLRPDGQERHIDVELELDHHATKTLLVSDALAASFITPRAHDDDGPVPITLTQQDKATLFSLKRQSRGTLRLSYRLPAASDFGSTKILATAVDPNRMRVAGERVLALPKALDRSTMQLILHIDPSKVRGQGAASSFGVGSKHEFRCNGKALRHASFVAGEIGTATFRSPWARDTSVYLGQFGFAPRQIAADMAVFRTHVGQILGLRDPAPMTLMWLTDARPSGQYLVTNRSSGLLIVLSAGERWSPGLRLAVATAITQRWIGNRLWIKPGDEQSEADAYWFSEGVARWFAATALLHGGLLSLDDYAAEMNGLLAITVTSKDRALGQAKLSKRYRTARQGLPLMVARGALYALELDARLRADKTSSLAEVLAKMLRHVARDRGQVPLAKWHQAIDAPGLATSSAALHSSWIIEGSQPKPSQGALSSCFRRVRGSYDVFALGFDSRATMRTKTKKPIALDPKGPAARAGLRADDSVQFVHHRPGRTEVEVRIAVRRNDKLVKLRYLPVGKRLPGPRFQRHGNLRDHECQW